MKELIFGSICFTVGALCGCLVTAIVLKKKHKQEIENIKETNELLKERRKQKTAEQTESRNDEVTTEENYISEDLIRESGEEDLEQTPMSRAETRDYSQLRTVYRKDNLPYNIDRENYEDHNGYDKVEVTFYEKDETVILDATGMPLDDADALLGISLGNLDEEKADETDLLTYIRNDSYSTDYQVDRCPDSFFAIEEEALRG